MMSLADGVLSKIQELRPDITGDFLLSVAGSDCPPDDESLLEDAADFALAKWIDVNTRRRDEGREGLAQKLGL